MRDLTLRSPVWTQKFTELRLKRHTVQFSELGREILCSTCHEWWPADNEFYDLCSTKPAGLASQCRACTHLRWEKNREKAKAETIGSLV